MALPRQTNFYTPKEAATLLQVSVATMYRYATRKPEKGGPPVKRLSKKCIRFPKPAFDRWAGIEG